MNYILFSAMEQLGIIADKWWYSSLFLSFSPPSALPCLSFKQKGCACVETVINLFPIALPMTLFSAVRLRETLKARPWWIWGHSNPPRAVCADACHFDKEKVSCGICGFSGIVNYFICISLPLQCFVAPLSYEKSDHCRRLKPRLSFWACVCRCRLLIVCVFRPGVDRLWGVTMARMCV